MGVESRIMPRPEVVCTPGIMGGMPCISGTRIPAETLLLYLREGTSRFDIFVDYPSLPQGGIEAVVLWAAGQGIDVQVPD
jgi:uncharacterized protein (DUF433 family)